MKTKVYLYGVKYAERGNSDEPYSLFGTKEEALKNLAEQISWERDDDDNDPTPLLLDEDKDLLREADEFFDKPVDDDECSWTTWNLPEHSDKICVCKVAVLVDVGDEKMERVAPWSVKEGIK